MLYIIRIDYYVIKLIYSPRQRLCLSTLSQLTGMKVYYCCNEFVGDMFYYTLVSSEHLLFNDERSVICLALGRKLAVKQISVAAMCGAAWDVVQ